MAEIKNGIIPDMNTSWENYSGSSVESFIKDQLRKSCGYIHRTPNKIGDYYYLYGFQSIDEYYDWADGKDITPLFKVQLPNVENDTFAAELTTNSNTSKLVNLGDGVKVQIRYTSTSTNPNTGVVSDTFNDGTLHILRSSNGSSFTEVGKKNIQAISHTSSSYYVLDLTEYLADGDNKIRLRVEDNVNGAVTNLVTFQSIINTSLVVTDATDNSKPLTSLSLQYYIEGQISKTLHLKVTDASNNTENIQIAIGDSTYWEVPYILNMDKTYPTGIIHIEAWLSVDETTLESKHIHSEYFFIDESTNDCVVILNNKATSISNYSNVKFFDFALFNSGSDVDIVISDGNTTFLSYKYTDCVVGVTYSFYNTLEIESTSDSINAIVRVSTKDMVSEYPIVIDNSVKMYPTEGADFVINPKLRSNSEGNPSQIINSIDQGIVSSTFTNFDFHIDGWKNDADGIGVLRIPAGRKLNIEYDPLDSLSNGATIEFDFNVYNVFNEDNVVFRFCSYKNQVPLGFEMKATEAVFMTTEKQTRRDQDIMFQDETRTHIAINIIPNLSNSGLNYVRIFINGIMNREFLYTDSDIFKNGVLTLELGADNCDLDVYGMRVYKKGLSANDVRQDYLSSLPDLDSKIAFRDANDIVSSNGTISYDKAVTKYNTLVWTGKHPEYCTGNLKFMGSLAINIIDDPEHSGIINDIQIKGQGSSSRGYWKWNHQFDFKDKSVWIDGNGVKKGAFYQLQDNSPKARKLVSKLNWASSMQSHKMGSTSLYNDLWKAIVGGNSITQTEGYESSRVAVEEKPFMYFIKETPDSNPTFAGLVTFGSGKADVATFQGSKEVFGNYLMIEGSDNGMPLTLRQVPWLDTEVVYNEDEEFWEYNGEGQLDYDLGNRDNISYFKDAFNFAYLHSTRLKPYTSESELSDVSYQYWNTSTYNVMRYDHISKSWVNAGITKDEEGNYSVLNIKVQTGITPSGNTTQDNQAFIDWRIADFKAKVSNYYKVNDVLYTMAFLKMVAASDNRCKNTYEYLDPITYKICMMQDDMDTIFLTDNVGRKVKPYYVEEHDKHGTNFYWNGEDNVFYNLMEQAFSVEYKAMMKTILDTMGSTDFGGSVESCLNRYFFSIQSYFPSVAFNETARILYEEASVKQASGEYKNGTPAISQSLGDQLQAEKQWWKRRTPYLQSLASSKPFYVRSNGSLGFRSILTTASGRPNFTFALTPWQWIYPKIGVGQSMGSDNTRVQALTKYNTSTITTDGNTDCFIYGANYFTNFGEFADKSIGETFELSGDRLLEFSADSRKISGEVQFRPIAMKVSCPNLKRLVLYGISTLSGNLDLSGCPKLESADLRGTGINSISFPETSTLRDLNIPNVSSIILVGCKSLENVYFENLSNLTSLTTDSTIVLNSILNNATNLQDVHLQGVDYDAAEKSELVYDLLLREGTTASGTISLNKALTIAEKNELVKKYGNIDDVSNGLHVIYTLVSQSSISIVGDSTITQTLSKEYKIDYGGNDFISFEWKVTNATFKADGATCTITAPMETSDDIYIECKMYRVDKTPLTANKTISIRQFIKIQSIQVSDLDIYDLGEHTLNITYNPSVFTAKIYDVKARIDNNKYVSVKSVNENQVVLVCTQLVASRIATFTLTIDVTDSQGYKVSTTSTIRINNPIKDYFIENKNLNDNPTITNKIKEEDIISFNVQSGVGTDDWYIASVTPSSRTVSASVVSGTSFTLSTKEEENTIIKLKIKFHNKSGEKELQFTWRTTITCDNLCFTSTGDSTISFNYEGGKGIANLYISKDEQDWQLWDYSEVKLADGEKLYLYGTDFQQATGSYSYFKIEGNIKISGDLVALRDGLTEPRGYDFLDLFKQCKGITDASQLNMPSKVESYGLQNLFKGCSSLKYPPKMPKKKVGFYGCYGMFEGCTSLLEAPELPATSIDSGAYGYMFLHCTSLKQAPELPAIGLSTECYKGMFHSCTSLVKAMDILPATRITSRDAYNYMFYGCTSLEVAPVLPAKEIYYDCYAGMFYECSKLNYVKALFTSNIGCCENWLYGVSSSGTFVKNAEATWDVVGVSGVPEGWTIQTITV